MGLVTLSTSRLTHFQRTPLTPSTNEGLTMRESILDLSLAIVLGLAFAVLALAYFDCLYL